ncbi:Serine/threonine-protein kinase RIO1 [Phytophthora citrophthora]|uniref:non-specific serine/threonine protein kinase n=1 Tax=Phytophthora citrophthora TaxID=4793 RepID=A0AAD9G9Y4_9STRA|nr:Serine/threonine-protein kinase RIO1 [Phytophthora citrophthora]
MATTCPWQMTTPTSASTQQPSSPTLQQIMDEELALRMQDEEWVRLAALEDSDALDFDDSEGDLEEKEPVPAEVQNVQNDDEDTDLRDDDYDEDIENGKEFNSLHESMRRQAKHEGHRGTYLAKGRIDLGRNGSGSHENMFDEDTQSVLRKLVRKELVTAVNTRAHTGREANVYHAVGLDKVNGEERGLALKVFKTNKGDFTRATACDPTGRRFGVEYVRKSIRRQLKMQAEREYKYLVRAGAALELKTVTETEEQLASASRGARVPKPLILRSHTLVTEFVGSNGHLAPSLEDAKLSSVQLSSAYIDLLRAVRQLYQRARLVHGRLSGKHIRYHNDRCWIMGIGRAVDLETENASVFLMRDLDNLNSFFRSSGIPAVSKGRVGVLSADVAKDYVMTESPDQLLRRFPVLEPLLRD